MSRYHKDRDDKGVAKKGAGAYSRSYLKLNKPPEYSPFAQAGNTDHHQGKDISRRVFPVSTRNFGLSAEVSRGNRPAHKAGKLTGSGIDSPDSVKFRKHKDYR
jgi:hypothetical protein